VNLNGFIGLIDWTFDSERSQSMHPSELNEQKH